MRWYKNTLSKEAYVCACVRKTTSIVFLYKVPSAMLDQQAGLSDVQKKRCTRLGVKRIFIIVSVHAFNFRVILFIHFIMS